MQKPASGSSTVMATTRADINGNYKATISFDASAKPDVFVRVFARSAAANVSPSGGTSTYFMDSDVVKGVTDGLTAVSNTVAKNNTDDQYTAFSVLSAMTLASAYATQIGSGGKMPSQIDARFSATETGTYYESGTTIIHVIEQDRWDWDVVDHEYGHYVEKLYNFGTEPSISYSHSTGQNLSETYGKEHGTEIAFAEGWPTFFAIEASLNLAGTPYAKGVPGVGNTLYEDTEDASLSFDLATSVGNGEDDEQSVRDALYHLVQGDQGIRIDPQTMLSEFSSSTVETMGAAWDAIANPLDNSDRVKVAKILGGQKIAPVETAPDDNASLKLKDSPTFKWDKNGGGPSYKLNQFKVAFYSSDMKTRIFETPDLGDVDHYQPTADDWKKIFKGHDQVKWVVEGKNTANPETPGGKLGWYWSDARKVGGIKIGFVIDDTGSMSDEIDSVKSALQAYIDEVRASVPEGEDIPTLALTTFKDDVTPRLATNDLDAMKAAVGALFASGGGDCPEASAQALMNASEEIAPGGTLLLATDALTHPGVDLDGVIADLRSKGITVNVVLSGDCSEDPSVSGASAALTASRFSVPVGAAPVAVAESGADCNCNGGDASASTVSGPAGTAGSSVATAVDTLLSGIGAKEGVGVALEPPKTTGGTPGTLVTPLDDHGDTPDTATQLIVNGRTVGGVISVAVQDAEGLDAADPADFFSVFLEAGKTYAIMVRTDGSSTLSGTLLDQDGTTSLATLPYAYYNGESTLYALRYTANSTGGYFVEISGKGLATFYTIRVSDSALDGVSSSLRLFSTVAAQTGGVFQYKDSVKSGSADDLKDYTSTLLNVMTSTLRPTVLTATPGVAPAGTPIDIELDARGTNWLPGVTTVAFSGDGLTVNSVNVTSATSLIVSLVISPDASLGFRDVTVTTQIGTSTESATGSSVLRLDPQATAPTLLQVSPSTFSQGQTATITVRGVNTAWDSTSTLSFGPGMAVSALNVVSPTEMTATIMVNPGAGIGFRTATVTTATQGTQRADRALFVSAAPLTTVPFIDSISPRTGDLGARLDVAVTGTNTHFAAGVTTASFADGVSVSSLDVIDNTHAVAHILVSLGASPGFRDVSLSTGTEMAVLLQGFLVSSTIVHPAQLVSVSPGSIVQGQRAVVTIRGVNTAFTAGSTTASLGLGITIVDTTVIDPTDLSITIIAAPGAATGLRDVTVTTGSENLTLTGAFTVLEAPVHPAQLVSVSPGSIVQGQRAVVTIRGVNTAFTAGSTTASLGLGITIVDTTVIDPTDLSITIIAAPGAATGLRDVTVTTGSENLTLTGAFTVLEAPVHPAQLVSVSPRSIVQGQRAVVTIRGVNTAFTAGSTTASLGLGITIVDTTVIDPTDLSITIIAAPGAATGLRDVTVTTGSENLTLTGAVHRARGSDANHQARPR